MQIDTTALGATSPPPRTDRSTALDRDAFLRLLVTQLKNQDPMSPLQPHEFAAQLAQFSSVEQLVQLNAALELQAGSTAAATLASQTSLGASLLGRDIVAKSDALAVAADGTASLLADVNSPGGQATLRLLDANGDTVATRALGGLAPGEQTIELDGLPEGVYRLELDVASANGAEVPARTYVTGTVDGLTFTNGQPYLVVGGVAVPVGDLVEILPSSPE